MPASSFDFDVITGPSTPRETTPPQDKPAAPPSDALPPTPRPR